VSCFLLFLRLKHPSPVFRSSVYHLSYCSKFYISVACIYFSIVMVELARPAKCGDCPQFQLIREPTRSEWGGRCACLKLGRDAFSDSCDQPRNWGKKGENNGVL